MSRLRLDITTKALIKGPASRRATCTRRKRSKLAFKSAAPVGLGSLYETEPLKNTLDRLVDFDRINAGEKRLCGLSIVDAEGV
jgi:hypothetical protein